jgi:hypothetical protein
MPSREDSPYGPHEHSPFGRDSQTSLRTNRGRTAPRPARSPSFASTALGGFAILVAVLVGVLAFFVAAALWPRTTGLAFLGAMALLAFGWPAIDRLRNRG